MSRSSISTWARAAISGTTPPKGACSAIWLITSSARISPAPVRPQPHDRRRRLVAGGLNAENAHC